MFPVSTAAVIISKNVFHLLESEVAAAEYMLLLTAAQHVHPQIAAPAVNPRQPKIIFSLQNFQDTSGYTLRYMKSLDKLEQTRTNARLRRLT